MIRRRRVPGSDRHPLKVAFDTLTCVSMVFGPGSAAQRIVDLCEVTYGNAARVASHRILMAVSGSRPLQ
jgi:hypothetical protein